MEKLLPHTIRLIVIGILSFGVATTAYAQSTLLKDISSKVRPVGSNPTDFRTVGGITYFIASSETFGRELWRTDGTEQGTRMVRDINIGGEASNPTYVGELGNIVLYKCFTHDNGAELWRTDGTREGTSLVIDFWPGGGGSDPVGLGVLNGELYLSAYSEQVGFELWKTDGTNEGTKLVADTQPGTASGSPEKFVLYNNWAYFSGPGARLWRTNGVTTEQTDVAFFSNFTPVVYRNSLYFESNGSLLKSNGTQSGTELVYDFLSLGEIKVLKGKLYFVANNPDTGEEPWVSDGTPAGTKLLIDAFPGNAGSDPSNFMSVDVPGIEGLIVFQANDGKRYEVWRTNGKPEGTRVIHNFETGTAFNLITADDQLYFTRGNDDFSGQLWKYDVITEQVQAIDNTLLPVAPESSFYMAPGKLLFTGGTTQTDRELWITDGTGANTRMVKELNIAPESSYPRGLTKFGNQVYFSAANSTDGSELWRTNGTPEGTTIVSPLEAENGRNPEYITEMDGSLYFAGRHPLGGTNELWKLNETQEPTLVYGGPNPLEPLDLLNFNGKLLFSGTSNSAGRELWRSDGTQQGTVLLKDINPGQFPSAPTGFIKLNNSTVLFRAYTDEAGFELWRTNGTADGTMIVKDLLAGNESGYPVNMVVHRDEVFFIANTENSGYVLWKTNGTPEGTVMLKDINQNSAFVDIRNYISSRNQLFFTADDGIHGLELWRTDGTEAGTVMVKDIVPGEETSNPGSLVEFDGKVLFTAYDDNGNFMLFISDGTQNGTFAVKKIGTRDENYHSSPIVKLRNTYFFKAGIPGSDSYELWKTNGTFCSTIIIGDDTNMDLDFPVLLGDKYIHTASDEKIGNELFSFTAPDVATCFQTLVFEAIPAKTVVDEPFELVAEVSSGLEIFFNSSNTNVATIQGKIVTIKGAGITTITAGQAGNDHYLPATPIERELVVAPITGLEKHSEDFIYYFPNPVHDVITIGSDYNEKPITVDVIDILGHRLTSAITLQSHTNGQSAELNISSLKSGLYYLRFTVGDNVITKAIVKN